MLGAKAQVFRCAFDCVGPDRDGEVRLTALDVVVRGPLLKKGVGGIVLEALLKSFLCQFFLIATAVEVGEGGTFSSCIVCVANGGATPAQNDVRHQTCEWQLPGQLRASNGHQTVEQWLVRVVQNRAQANPTDIGRRCPEARYRNRRGTSAWGKQGAPMRPLRDEP